MIILSYTIYFILKINKRNIPINKKARQKNVATQIQVKNETAPPALHPFIPHTLRSLFTPTIYHIHRWPHTNTKRLIRCKRRQRHSTSERVGKQRSKGVDSSFFTTKRTNFEASACAEIRTGCSRNAANRIELYIECSILCNSRASTLITMSSVWQVLTGY